VRSPGSGPGRDDLRAAHRPDRRAVAVSSGVGYFTTEIGRARALGGFEVERCRRERRSAEVDCDRAAGLSACGARG